MGQDDWYRNTTWDKETSELFETKLKRSRGAYHKAQYLRIQASYLLGSTDKELQTVGLELMERLIKEFPSEDFSTVFGKEQLGDYFFGNGDYKKAESYYRQVADHYKIGNRGGTSGVADIKLVDTILELDQREKFDTAYKLLTEDFEKTGGNLSLNAERFFYARVLADLCDKLGKSDEARQYADKALEVAKITEPQFNRHKNVGLVRTDKETLDKLTKIKTG
jgi:tetratricopeptide (TPR) repeat protein